MKLNWANQFTILRMLLIIPFVSCMLKINNPELGTTMRHIAIVIYLFMAISDGVDGYLARTKKLATKLGAFLDPVADKLLITCACLLLVSQRGQIKGFHLPTTVVVLIISKDLFLVIGFIIVYFITSKFLIAPAFIGKTANVLQLSMVAAILIAPEVSTVLPGWIWFLRVLWWSAAGTAIIATLVYIRMGSQYIEKYEQNSTNNVNK